MTGQFSYSRIKVCILFVTVFCICSLCSVIPRDGYPFIIAGKFYKKEDGFEFVIAEKYNIKYEMDTSINQAVNIFPDVLFLCVEKEEQIKMRIATERWIPTEDGKGICKKRKVKEVFDDLCEVLKKERLFPDEYFLLDLDPEQLWPEVHIIYCFAEWGGSEGIYLDIKMVVYDDTEESGVRDMCFATGKTLEETTEAFDRMQYIAGYIHRLLTGDGQIHSRYMRIQISSLEKEQVSFLNRMNSEIAAEMKQELYRGQNFPELYAEELAVKLMILHTISRNPLPKEEIETLSGKENILETLFSICKPVLETNRHKIEEKLLFCTREKNRLKSE